MNPKKFQESLAKLDPNDPVTNDVVEIVKNVIKGKIGKTKFISAKEAFKRAADAQKAGTFGKKKK